MLETIKRTWSERTRLSAMLVEEPISLLKAKKLIGKQTEERVAHDRAFEGRLFHCCANNQVDVENISIQRLQNVNILKHQFKTPIYNTNLYL